MKTIVKNDNKNIKKLLDEIRINSEEAIYTVKKVKRQISNIK